MVSFLLSDIFSVRCGGAMVDALFRRRRRTALISWRSTKAPRYRRLQVVCKCIQVVRTTMPYQSRLYPCTLPTAPVSRSFGLRSSYESVSLTPTKDPGEKEMRTQDSPFCLSALCRHCDQLKIIPSIPVRVPRFHMYVYRTFE